jgi:hypothetical protein
MFEVGGVDPLESMAVKLCASTSVLFLRTTDAVKAFTRGMKAALMANPGVWEAKLAQVHRNPTVQSIQGP